MSLQDRTIADEASSPRANQAAAAAGDQAREIGHSASEAAKQTAATTRDQAAQVTHEATQQLQALADNARRSVRTRVDEQTGQLQGLLESWAGQAQALSEGRMDGAGGAAHYAGQVADRLEHTARQIERKGFDGILHDLEQFARRRPAVFLLGAAAIGFGVGRVVRGAKASSPGDQGPRLGASTSSPRMGAPVGTGPSWPAADDPIGRSWSDPDLPAPGTAPRPGADYSTPEDDVTAVTRPVPPTSSRDAL